jgi:DNA-binding PadR family transcriptional regulator
VEATGSGATGGRRKTVYRITPEGEALFLELLEEPTPDGQGEDARFRVRLAFFRYLSPEKRIRLMERRRAGLQERLDEIKAAAHGPAEDDDYQRALLEHGRAATEADIAWLNALIQQERTKYGITAPVGEKRRASATLRRKERTA